ncbi:hypothetical protein QGP82_22505 [Leptothoe sp. LEGE 181152]|nr:hypothetical protein [Leptothoe sp. LEGE 181152]
MTSQKDQIQRLITEIEATLAKPASRLPLGLSGEAERQRQLLSKLFSYLQSLQQTFDSPGGWGPIDPETGQFVSPQAGSSDVEESASQVLQGLLLEMRYLRDNSLKPMRQELETLQQKRDSLQAEINVLEAQRVTTPLQSEEQIAAFLETLMQRLQEQLSAQMVQSFAAMEAATLEQLATTDEPAPLLTGQRLEQVRLLQAQSDQLLLKLDSTLTAVFDSLQKSVDSYRESLEDGLDQMHGLGRQGEVIFHAFVNHLAQQLGQDASSYLAGDIADAERQGMLQDPEDSVTTEVDLDAVQLDELDQALENLSLEESIAEDAVTVPLELDPDLVLPEDAIASEAADDFDDDITLIQTDTLSEQALLEEAMAFHGDIDEDITVIQADNELVADIQVDLDEEITLIQDDETSELGFLEQAISSSEEAPEATFVDSDDVIELSEDSTSTEATPAAASDDAGVDVGSDSLNLDLPLGDIDENLRLLALGADSGELIDSDKASDELNQDGLAAAEAENELFSFDFDTDLDLGLETDEEEAEAETVDRLAAALFPEEPVESDVVVDEASEEETVDRLAAALFPEESVGVDDVSGSEAFDDVPTFDPTTIAIPEPPSSETDMSAAGQLVDDWLFARPSPEGSSTEGDDSAAIPSELLDNLSSDESAMTRPMEDSQEATPEVTVETIFGDSLVDDENDLNDEGPDDNTVASLFDLLPDEQPSGAVEEFPENVPDDVYIAASADEDLINLVESGAEQRLLIDFDDGKLVEQLDEDLQKLAGDNFANDYGVEEDDSLEPLDQATLETIVRDLNLEDLDFDADSEAGGEDEPVASIDIEASELSASSLPDAESVDEAAASLVQPPSDERSGFDLFEGFATDDDVDDPSANELDVAAITSSTATGSEANSQDLDLLGLMAEPMTDDLSDFDDFDDGLTDSLADELGGLSERSNALSQEPITDEVVNQILSDLEEPVIQPDDPLIVPTVDSTEPHLDSASMPDLPPDSLDDDDLDAVPPVDDDFLQEEQEAFWQTMADEERPQSLAAQVAGPEVSDADIEEMLDEPEEAADVTDMPLDAASISSVDDLDGLLRLDEELPLPSQEMVAEESLDLGGLDELFGESVPELEALDQAMPGSEEEEATVDPLAALGLDADISPETSPDVSPEGLIPEVPELLDVGMTIDPIADSTIETSEAVEMPEAPITMPPEPVSAMDLEGHWFLGLDVGSTGLSAVLMNRQTGQVYPIYWQAQGADPETKHFRLPAMAVVTAAQETVAVGYNALGDLEGLLNQSGAELVGLNRLKPLLKVAVGHGQTLPNSDPWLRWSDTVELPMLQVLQAMVALLKYVVDQGQAVGLEDEGLAQIWQKLQGVIVGYPTNWPDTYSFNLREAVLAAGLIDQPEQIVFVEDAIATILSGLPDPKEISLTETVSLSRQPSLYNCKWQEGTVVISGGAVMTELGLVSLPKDLTHLNYADFALRGFAYAGDALDQDIVCQLLLPEERWQPLSEADATIAWDWQGHLAEDADWQQFDNLTLPAVGHVDWAQRYSLQQHLLGSSLGQSLLAAARHLKLTLQQQNQMQITLAGKHWLIKRRHLENLIFLPYIQRINRYLNVLLSHHSVDSQGIKQVICTGGSASLPAIARWLRQKFPNATIIQDTYASELPHSCSRVAYGLVNLARYPQVLNVTRQQYSDYFLLMELLRVFPQQPLPVGAIMHLLEQRGINTQACHLHILALLEGHLPPGLVPTAADRGLICDRTADLPTYRALLQTPLFSKTVTESGGQMYIPNEVQAEQLRAYVNRLLVNKVQTLDEPLIAHLEVLA